MSRYFPSSLIVTLLIGIHASVASAASTNVDYQSFSASVPADVGLFIEAHGIDDLLISFTNPELWSTLSDFAGQPANRRDAVQWRRQVTHTIKMSPAEAIQTLFAGGVAFIGEGALRSPDAVILCRPSGDISTTSLLEKWSATPLPPPPGGMFALPLNIGLGVRDDVLTFGNPRTAEGLFRRTVATGTPEGPTALAEDPAFQKLLCRVSDDPNGLLFLRLKQAKLPPIVTPDLAEEAADPEQTTQPTTKPAPRVTPANPSDLMGGSENVLIAMYREGNVLQFTGVGDAPTDGNAGVDEIVPLIRTFPEDTLAAWGGHVDYTTLTDGSTHWAQPNVLKLAFAFLGRNTKNLSRIFDTPTAVAIGCVEQKLAPDSPPLPSVALVLTIKDVEGANRVVEQLAGQATMTYNLYAIKNNARPIETKPTEFAGIRCWTTDLSPLISHSIKTTLAELHVSWAIDGDALIVTTHIDWLKRIISSRHGDAKRLTNTLFLAKRPVMTTSYNVIVAQTGPTADVTRLWLHHLYKRNPEILREKWWRDHPIGGRKTRLGISVRGDVERRVAVVTSVDKNVPADGFLVVGDIITSCNGQPFGAENPVTDIIRGIAERDHARWVELSVIRNGEERPIRIPLPFFNPIRTLRQIVAIGSIAQRMVYCDDITDMEGPRGSLTVELRTDTPPNERRKKSESPCRDAKHRHGKRTR